MHTLRVGCCTGRHKFSDSAERVSLTDRPPRHTRARGLHNSQALPAEPSGTEYRVFQNLQDSRLGFLPLCPGQGRLRGASLLSPLVPLAQAGR